MSEEVKMPQMGESIAEGTIVRWLKQVGDQVKRDEPLFEISTDKVDAEIPAPASGTLSEIKVQEGETVPINTVVAVINGAGGAASAPPAKKAAPAEAPAPPPDTKTPPKQPQAGAPPKPEPKAATPPPKTEEPPRQAEPQQTARAEGGDAAEKDSRDVRSSPLVRKIAAEHGIDIAQIDGTGISGRVTKNDILSFIENRPAGAKEAPGAAEGAKPAAGSAPVAARPQPRPAQTEPGEAGPQPFADGDRVEIEPMTMMRRRIAERMVESRRISAHVTSFMEIDFTQTSRVRDELKGEYLKRDGVKLTFMPFIIKAVIEGIKKWPIINSSVWGDQIVYKKDINVGVAVALDWGLIVPVVRNADEKSLLGLARGVNDLGERARNKQLKPDEVQGGTFTITNPGVFGGLIGTPIINQPQVAILGVGVIKKRPVVIDDAIAIRQIGMLSLSFDHRVIDGAVADQFLAVLRDVIEAAEYTS